MGRAQAPCSVPRAGPLSFLGVVVPTAQGALETNLRDPALGRRSEACCLQDREAPHLGTSIPTHVAVPACSVPQGRGEFSRRGRAGQAEPKAAPSGSSQTGFSLSLPETDTGTGGHSHFLTKINISEDMEGQGGLGAQVAAQVVAGPQRRRKAREIRQALGSS